MDKNDARKKAHTIKKYLEMESITDKDRAERMAEIERLARQYRLVQEFRRDGIM